MFYISSAQYEPETYIYCDEDTIANGHLTGRWGWLICQYGCSNYYQYITYMLYVCTDFSVEENWSFGERRLTYNFTGPVEDTITIGFTGGCWIFPLGCNWNISTTFSLSIRNDTGQINSSPRTITTPVIRLQQGCNHTIPLAVSDPDGDIIKCRWAVGRECGGVCNVRAFPGAELYRETCIIRYEANRGTGILAAAVMIEDFLPGSQRPLSSVALQFIVLVVASTDPCSQQLEFIDPTPPQGSCIAIPPGTTFTTQLTATSGNSSISINEIQIIAPNGTRKGELEHNTNTNAYYVNITWMPTVTQQNETHSLCYTAVNSEGLASNQTCIQLLAGYYPPAPIPNTATPNQQLVHPFNTTWYIEFDKVIQRPLIPSYIIFYEFTSREVYRIDVSFSQEVVFNQSRSISVAPNYFFMENKMFYINFEEGVVRGTEACQAGNKPVTNETFWTFETQDIAPVITLLQNPIVSNSSISLSWESNENATWECSLVVNSTTFSVNCSGANWRGYNLSEGRYELVISATDDAGNVATLVHTFEVDLTPPIVNVTSPLSNQVSQAITFTCNEMCTAQCQLSPDVSNRSSVSCDYGIIYVFSLEHNNSYTLSIIVTDVVGNRAEPVYYMWETDFEPPVIFGINLNTNTTCGNTSPNFTGQAQATDDKTTEPLLDYYDYYYNYSIGSFVCSILIRHWTALDDAGNVGYLTQIIHISLELSYVPFAFSCDSTTNMILVPTNTAPEPPNSCNLLFTLSFTDSVSEYVCPGHFVRNWTLNTCYNTFATRTYLQDIVLHDLCPPYPCRTNESTPMGICPLGRCHCNTSQFDDNNCSMLIYKPIAEQVNDSVLQEAVQYLVMLTVSQGTPPLTWRLFSGPPQLMVDPFSGLVNWSSAQAGNHSVTVQVENQVGSARFSWNLTVIPGYTTSLYPISPNLFPRALPIRLTGSVEYANNSAYSLVQNNYAVVVPVDIDIINNGYSRTRRAFTNANGYFAVTFYPPSSLYGYYQAGSRHPSQSVAVPQIEWGIQGMKSIPAEIFLTGEAVHNFQNTFYNASIICNDGPGIISGLTATSHNSEVVSMQILLNSNITLQTGDKMWLDIYLMTSQPVNGFLRVTVQSTEGVELYINVNYQIAEIPSPLLVLPPSINSRVLRGSSEVFEFNITYTTESTLTIDSFHILLSDNNVTSIISFENQMGNITELDLQSGESAILSILVRIPNNQQLGNNITTSISINSTDQLVHVSIPIQITVSSNVLINLTVIVEDECTYNASGEPLVNDAAITLINYQRGVRITLTTEAGNGTVTFINIYEDRYEMFAEAPNHLTFHQVIITSVDDPVMTVFMHIVGPCPPPPEFIDPTPPQGSCIAIPPGTPFTTQLTATSSSSTVSITAIEVVSPVDATSEELQHIAGTNVYYVNISWTPAANEQNETHSFCYTAVNSKGITSEQFCIQLLVGYYPPAPIPDTATPNQQLVYPSNTTWYIEFDRDIQRPVVPSYIIFYKSTSEMEVYSIDASMSPEVSFDQSRGMSIVPNYYFMEKRRFYINLLKGVVRGTEGCGPPNEPVTSRTFWTFEVVDVTPPNIRFLQNPILSNSSISLSWESNENVTWECSLVVNSTTSSINCSGANWRGYNLSEGRYELMITATDDAGNVATLVHTFEVDPTPPIVTITDGPSPLSNQVNTYFRFTCDEVCTTECHLSSDTLVPLYCNWKSFYARNLQHNKSYTLTIVATDRAGNRAEPVYYTWETDFERPVIFGILKTNISCGDSTRPNFTGQAQVTDDRTTEPYLRYYDFYYNYRCLLRRNWIATDDAGNSAYLTQEINILYANLSYLPLLSFSCDSTANVILVPSNTATEPPNHCGLWITLSYTDSVSEYTCPGQFVRNWTLNVCNAPRTYLQDIVLYDLCPPYPCRTNESTPMGICPLGRCHCNTQFDDSNCSMFIYKPIAEQVNDSVLQETEQYSDMLTVSQGTPPLYWRLVSRLRGLSVNFTSGLISWSRAEAGNYTVSARVTNNVGQAEFSWNLTVIQGYTTFLHPVSPRLYSRPQRIVLTGSVEYVENNVVHEYYAGSVPVVIDIVRNGIYWRTTRYTDADGNFTVVIHPHHPSEYGYFQAGSRHPSQSVPSIQTAWGIQGLKATPNEIFLTGEAVSDFQAMFYNATIVCNDGPGNISGLMATTSLTNSEQLSSQILLNSNVTLQSGDKVALNIYLFALPPVNRSFQVTVQSTEGVVLDVDGYIQIERILFEIVPKSINTRMLQGESENFEFNITNIGRITANSVQVFLPNNGFISHISFGNQTQNMTAIVLERGQSEILSITIQVPPTHQPGYFNFTINVNSTQITGYISIRVIVLSNLLMNFTVILEDVCTYNTSNRPLVNDAAITLISYQRDTTQTAEAGNGTVTFINIYEDRYEMFVEAPNHLTLHQVIITSVDDPVMTVFMHIVGPCPLPPEFIDPTPPQGSCIAIPPGTTFVTQLTATSGSSSASVTEIQTISPNGTRIGELQYNTVTSNYYVNITWTPAVTQQNETHSLCYTAVNSESLGSNQTCIQLLVGYYPPAPIPNTATPNQQLVYPSNTTWYIEFDNDVQRSSIPSYIVFHEFTSDLEVYRIDASLSSEVSFAQSVGINITPNHLFTHKEKFYITFNRGIVRGIEECGPGNEPIANKTFWTFRTMDLTAPTLTFILNPQVSNGSIFLSWESDENVTWECSLVVNSTTSSINCSEANWRGYNLSEGRYELMITATDDAGNVATLVHTFEVDMTPPTIIRVQGPPSLSNQVTSTIRFTCDEFCIAECQLSTEISEGGPISCNSRRYYTPTLLHNTTYTLSIVATDQVGNTAEPVTYTWDTDFVSPSLFGVTNTSVSCGNTSPSYTGQAQVTDDIGVSSVPTYVDAQFGCSLRRRWRAEDNAGNVALLDQYINILYTSTLSYLPQLSFPCESASNLIQVPSNTATAPNPCRLPLQLSYTDTVSEHSCPGEFVRNWTINVCSLTTSVVQDIVVYDVCPPYACGRNESTPRGICSLGECQCIRPWYGDNCSLLIYEPIAEQVNNTILREAEQYSIMLTLSQGTPPLTWSLVSGPPRLRVDFIFGLVSWSRSQAGNHTVIVQVENQVGQAQLTWELQVIPGYNAILNPVSPNNYPYSQPIVLTGTVEYTSNNLVHDFLAGFVPVDIDITSNKVTRTIRTFTNANGSFVATFYPAILEYGSYLAGSRHPIQPLAVIQAQWGFQGMKATPNTISLFGKAVSDFEKIFYNTTFVCNDGPGVLSDLIAVSSLGNSDLVSVQLLLPSNVTLQPDEKVSLDIQLLTRRPVSGFFIITVQTSQGTSLQINVNFQIEPILPHFVIEPPSLNTRVVRGRSQVFMFNITNNGRITANAIQALLPNNNIISFISFGNQPQNETGFDLQRGYSAILSISTQLPSNQELGDISASITIFSTQLSASIPIRLTVSSNLLMNLTVIVEDEFTYFASGEPLVNDAAITLINYQRGIRITLTTEAGNGTVTFINIYEDRYEMFVEAPDHLSLRQVLVTSVDDPVMTVFMQRQTVTYTWSVTPVEFEDSYELTIEADFVTHVPIPIVTVYPAEIDLEELELGFVSSFQINITNHGLIRANQTRIELPDNHPFLKFTIITTELGYIEPLSSVIVTVDVSRKITMKRQINCGAAWIAYGLNILYNYICGGIRNRMVPVILKKQANIIASHCGGSAVSNRVSCTGCRSSDGSGGGGFRFDGYVAGTTINCQACIQALLGCLPLPPAANCMLLLARGTDPRTSVINALSWIQCTINNPWLGIALCGYNLVNECLGLGSSKRNIERSANQLVEALFPILQSIELSIEVLGDNAWITDVDDPHWLSQILQPTLDDSSEAGILISTTELSTILVVPPPNGTTTVMVQRLVERLNDTLHGWNSGQLEPMGGANMASFSRVQNFTESIGTYNDIAINKGFSSYIEAYNFARDEIVQNDEMETEGVCAIVRIRIEQELAVTRTAFLARLEIESMNESPLERIDIAISIFDSGTGEKATHLFAIGNGSLSGSLTDVDGGWTLPSEESGSIEWLMIPFSEAAPESDQSYDVGGMLRYSLDGENITIPLVPAVVTVTPDPSLLVHYFWERFVVGDDPFTDEVEDSVPFTLGVAVKNAGHGVASSLQITSGQPEIIENERGLLINFMIIGAMIGNGSIEPSLTVMFGDVPPDTTKVARWQIISSLQGEFRNYSATFENINPLGDPNLSILDELEIHELIRNVRIYNLPEDDGVLDFLVNELDDFLAFPDALYSSKTLERYNVSVGTILSVRSITTTLLEVRTFTNTTGWVYYRYEDTQGILRNTTSGINATKAEDDNIFEVPAENLWITRGRSTTSNSLHLHIIDAMITTDEVVFTLSLCASDCEVLERSFARSIPSEFANL